MGKKVMVMEPAFFPRGRMKQHLTNAGYEVIDDVDKAQCVARYSSERPDVLIVSVCDGLLDDEACAILDGVRGKDARAKVLVARDLNSPSLRRYYEDMFYEHGAVAITSRKAIIAQQFEELLTMLKNLIG